MVKNINDKLLKYLSFILIICLFLFFMYKMSLDNQNYEINIVDNLNLETKQEIKVCVINIENDNYEVINMYFDNTNIIENVFNFYISGSSDLDEKYKVLCCQLYYLDSFKTDKDVLYLNLKDGKEDLNINVFKMMKISYSFLNYDNIVVRYNGKDYKI